MDFDKLINKKLFNILNEINNKEGYLTTIRTTNLSNELLETLKITEGCISCKDNLGEYNLDEFHRSINEVKNLLVKLEEKEQELQKKRTIYELNCKLITMDFGLNR